MTPADEDALVMQAIGDDYCANSVTIRAAIRAAVAHERERIARQWDGCQYDDVGGSVDVGAAIRRGKP